MKKTLRNGIYHAFKAMKETETITKLKWRFRIEKEDFKINIDRNDSYHSYTEKERDEEKLHQRFGVVANRFCNPKFRRTIFGEIFWRSAIFSLSVSYTFSK